jgi:cytochrome P450
MPRTESSLEDPTVRRAPGGWPLLGHTVPFLHAPLPTLAVLGTAGPLTRVRIGPVRFHLVNDPSLIRRIAVDAQHFERGHIFTGLREVFGNGLVTVDGPTHRRHRRLMLPAFHRDRIRAYARTIGQAVADAIAQWRPGQQLAVDVEMADLAASATMGCLFSSADGPQTHTRIRQALPVVVQQLLRHIMSPSPLARIPTRANRNFAAATTEIHAVVREMVEAYRGVDTERDDVLSLLMAARDETGLGLDDQQVHDEVVTLLLAGSDTTAMTLAWAFHELGRHPQAEHDLHVELDTVLGGEPVTIDSLPKLPYTRHVITEILRLYAVPLVMRRTSAATDLAGTWLPAGAEVAYSPYALHRNPTLYPDPERFEPDRWLPDRVEQLPSGAFIPFGVGAHTCIGEAFAMTVTTLTLATIAARWRLQPCPGRVRPVAGLAIHPDRLPMITTVRDPGQ